MFNRAHTENTDKKGRFMANNRPLTSEERLQIVEALKRGNLSHRALAQEFNRSQSTISQIARDAAIPPTHRRRRSPAAKDLEGSFTREERINLTDRVLGVIGGLVEG
jgi:IS30 family transposase